MNTIINGMQSVMAIQEIQTLLKLILIVFLSGVIGFEREAWNKPAGFKTYVLAGISAVMVMICGEYVHDKMGADPTRIPAQLLSGIGFLGAGTILRDGFNVKGLATAAGLLAITCIGLAVGAGFYLGAIIATAVVYVVLSYSHIFSDRLEHFNYLDLEVTSDSPKYVMNDIKNLFDEKNLEIVQMKIDKNGKILKIVAKYKNKLDLNDVILQTMKLDNVSEVVEVKEV